MADKPEATLPAFEGHLDPSEQIALRKAQRGPANQGAGVASRSLKASVRC